MAFEVSQFSNKGLELLGQLSSHKSLVVKNILAAETAYTADDFEQNIAWWTQETSATMAKVNASLSSAGHDKDQARLTIKFTAKPGQQDNIGIKTVIVIACGKESGVETDENYSSCREWLPFVPNLLKKPEGQIPGQILCRNRRLMCMVHEQQAVQNFFL